MNKNDWTHVLTSMGYRELHAGYWGKPIGFQLLTFSVDKGEICNWFKTQGSATTEYLAVGMGLWNSNTYDGCEDKLEFIKTFEATTRTNVLTNCNTEFEFFNPIDMYSLHL